MPAPTLVSAEEVAAAAAQLVGAGKPVTGWRLRGIIGIGSPARLAAIAREQAAAQVQDQPPPEPEAPALPPLIAEHLAEAETRVLADLRGLIGQAWARASELAGRRVAGEVEAARARGVELEAELAEAAAVLAATDERADGQAQELASLQDALSKAFASQQIAEWASQDAASRLEEVRASLAAANHRADDAEKAKSAAEAANRETETKLRAAETATVAAVQQADAAEGRAELAEAETRSIKVKLEASEAATVAADQRVAVAERRVEVAEQRSQEAAREREAATLAARDAEVSLKEVRAIVTAAERRAEAADVRLSTLLGTLRPQLPANAP